MTTAIRPVTRAQLHRRSAQRAGASPGAVALAPAGPPDLARAVRRLLAGLRERPEGQVSPSIYETGRLVALAPWLSGQAERIAFLLARQQPDGRWGGPGGYGLVPTLSATEALLETARRLRAGQRLTALPGGRRARGEVEREAVLRAAVAGVRVLRRWLRPNWADAPDMPAIDLIVPALIEAINGHLGELADDPPSGLGTRPLPVPRGLDHGRLGRLRDAACAGHAVPEKVVHALEVLGGRARGAAGVTVAPDGSIGASPAAAAAWLGPAPARRGATRTYLEALVARTRGPVPCGLPITIFERGWVLGQLGRVGLLTPVNARELVAGLAGALRGGAGVAAGAGLPADADTTSGALYALALAGRRRSIGALWQFETPTHFCTWPGEDGASPTVNAHVLEALWTGQFGASAGRVRSAIARTRRWLVAAQSPDGNWTDRWHASPYYATWCCALALDLAAGGGGREATSTRAAVRRAAQWVLDSQREDGSWGVWTGTAEETAYAVWILALAGARLRGAKAAIARGHALLAGRLAGAPAEPTTGAVDGVVHLADDPPMWHDKDLYRPDAIIGGAVVAALALSSGATGRPGR